MNEDQQFSNYLDTLGKLIDSKEPSLRRLPRISEGWRKACALARGVKYSVLSYDIQINVFKHFGLSADESQFVVLREEGFSVGYVLEKRNGGEVMLGLETPELRAFRLVNTSALVPFDLQVQQIAYDIFRKQRNGEPLGPTIDVHAMARRAARARNKFVETALSNGSTNPDPRSSYKLQASFIW